MHIRKQNIYVATSTVVIDSEAKILLIKRGKNPFKDMWALPGGFFEDGESSLQANMRELKEETGLEVDSDKFIKLLTMDEPTRDPRGYTIEFPYLVILDTTIEGLVAADDAKELKWFNLNELPELAFDHDEVIEQALSMIDLIEIEEEYINPIE